MYTKIIDRYSKVISDTKFLYPAFFVFVILTAFIHNGSISIWDQDEGAYALFGNVMLKTNNWVVPHAMWSEIHRKPPLHFWNIALSYKLFGVNEFALRFTAAVFTLLTYLLIFLGGGALFGRKQGFTAAVILSTSVLVPVLAKVSVVDSTLLFFTTLCAVSILFVLLQRKKIFVLVFWISFAAALLTKGPPVIIFTTIFGAVLLLLHPQRKNLLLFHPWFFLPLSIIPFAYWCHLTTLNDGGVFLKWMYDWYILKRINGSVLGQTGPPGVHLLLIVVFFFPYLMFIPGAFYTTAKNFFKDKEHALIFGAWFFAGWFIYELSPSKLPSYVLAAHIPFVFMLAQRINSNETPKKVFAIIHFVLQILIAVTIVCASLYLKLPLPQKIVFAGIGISLLLITLRSIYLHQHGNVLKGVFGYAIVLQVLVWVVALPVIDEFKNCNKRLAASLENESKECSVLIGNSRWEPPSLPFYLSRHFENIKEEHRLTELASAYCADSSTILILSDKQFQLLDSFLGNVFFKKFSNHEIFKSMGTEYFVVMNTNNRDSDLLAPIVVSAPTPALSANDYEKQITSSTEWMAQIEKGAKENGEETKAAVIKTALWYAERQKEIFMYDQRMRKNQKWLSLMQKRALEKHITIEDQCAFTASEFINQGMVY